jgi:hypothetical protein
MLQYNGIDADHSSIILDIMFVRVRFNFQADMRDTTLECNFTGIEVVKLSAARVKMSARQKNKGSLKHLLYLVRSEGKRSKSDRGARSWPRQSEQRFLETSMKEKKTRRRYHETHSVIRMYARPPPLLDEQEDRFIRYMRDIYEQCSSL